MQFRRSTASCWIMLSCAVALQLGCSDPATLSPKAYEITSALYTACRKADAEKLARIAELTAESLSRGEITEKESDVITAIVAIAESEGDWEEAARLSRELMESQVQGR